ncbi:MAG: acyl-CoA thioesterase II [Propionibacteriaceae bacterium]|jgi:acyl-CoA thioesterase-2|nr:acyl-CoA thioesterase II [Propionibacteriaceae bacterium]
MPGSVEELLELLELIPCGEHVFSGAAEGVARMRVFGGQVLAQAIMAAYQTVGKDRILHSLSAYYLRGGVVGTPITYTVSLVRDGGSFSFRRVKASQGERLIFDVEMSFHVAEPGLNHADQPPANVPAPDDCPLLSEVLAGRSRKTAEAWRQEWGVLDTRFVADTSSEDEYGRPDARMQVWVRASSKLPHDPRIHQAVLAYASDLTLLAVSTVPHPVQFAGPGMQVASINHAMWFHRQARVDQWLLYDEVSPSASAGLGFSFGRLFSGGQLIASAAQEGLIRLIDPAAVHGASLEFRAMS